MALYVTGVSHIILLPVKEFTKKIHAQNLFFPSVYTACFILTRERKASIKLIYNNAVELEAETSFGHFKFLKALGADKMGVKVLEWLIIHQGQIKLLVHYEYGQNPRGPGLLPS